MTPGLKLPTGHARGHLGGLLRREREVQVPIGLLVTSPGDRGCNQRGGISLVFSVRIIGIGRP